MPPVPNATAYCADDELVAIITEYSGGNSSRTVSDVRYMYVRSKAQGSGREFFDGQGRPPMDVIQNIHTSMLISQGNQSFEISLAALHKPR